MFDTNADLAGLRAREQQQERELAETDAQIARLLEQEAEFSRLKRAASQAAAYAELNGRKAAEAEIDNAWRSNEKLSTVQVAQAASRPLQRASPRARFLLPLGAAIGAFLGVAYAVMMELRRRSLRAKARKPRRPDPKPGTLYERAYSHGAGTRGRSQGSLEPMLSRG